MPSRSHIYTSFDPRPIADPDRYRDRIRAELIALVCSRLPAIILIQTILIPPLVVSLVWEVATPLQMIAWVFAQFAVVMTHGAVYLRYRIGTSHRSLWIELGLTMLAAGVFWSALLGYMFLVTPTFLYHQYLFLFLGALSVLALTILFEHMTSFVAFTGPQTVVLTTLMLMRGDPRYITLGVLGALSIAGMYLLGRSKRKNIVEALAMRFAVLEMAEELKAQRDTAHQANIAKSKFLAAASHDLRQPLHALALLNAALQEGDIDARSRIITNDMTAAITSLEKMYGALLDISRLDAGVLKPELRHFHLGELLRRVTDEFVPLARAKGITLSLAPCADIAYTDSMLLERILRNYLSNAVRYTHVGRIEVSCRRENSMLHIEVNDTGIGIPEELQSDIFDEFFQIDNSERDRSKGLGLGLAIVRRIAELLNHPIGVTSKVNVGSSFSIDVPIGQAVEGSKPHSELVPQKLDGLRVIVIDDDVLVRDSMRTLLATWRCEVVVAADVIEALQLAKSAFEMPDVLVVDLRLRDSRTGIDAIAEISEHYGVKIPALIVSGDTAPERLQQVSESGHALIHKPVQPAALRAFLSTAMRSRNFRT